MFVYHGVKGIGIVLQGEICHNHHIKDDKIRIQITSIEQDVNHLEHASISTNISLQSLSTTGSLFIRATNR